MADCGVAAGETKRLILSRTSRPDGCENNIFTTKDTSEKNSQTATLPLIVSSFVILCVPLWLGKNNHARDRPETELSLLFRRPQTILPVRPDEPADSRQQQQPDHRIKLVEVFAQAPPILSQLHAEVCQSETPWPRS